MRNLIKILFLSDIHYIHPTSRVHIDDVRWFLAGVKWLADWCRYFWFNTDIAERWTTYWDQKKRTYVHQALGQIAKLNETEFDEVVLLGDDVNGHQDQGLVTKTNAKEGRKILQILVRFFQRRPIKVPGGHEPGYILASGALGQIGISQESLKTYHQIFGQLFGARTLAPGLTLVWLYYEPFMVRKRWHHLFKKTQLVWHQKEQKKELAFLAKTLKSTNGKFILAVHDCGALMSPKLQKVLEPYRDRILVTLCGHFHGRWLANLIYYFINRGLKRVTGRYRVQIVPSIWGVVFGFWHLGAGCIEMEIDSTTGHVRLFVHYLSKRKPRSVELGPII
ncbi:MAG: hypothetical protein WCW26_03220 [Candidatus Buchananbacteria bacterium]